MCFKHTPFFLRYEAIVLSVLSFGMNLAPYVPTRWQAYPYSFHPNPLFTLRCFPLIVMFFGFPKKNLSSYLGTTTSPVSESTTLPWSMAV